MRARGLRSQAQAWAPTSASLDYSPAPLFVFTPLHYPGTPRV